ncbi:hypothetical protein MJM43_33260, partial [Salmonella enterica subsp. enterica serovar Montevideo]|nr:hypothetical protein [Salmonella enterica subsp. enterica serovar Montevideo]
VIENTNIINLIFIGNLCSFQNFDGVKWFVKNILPSINKNNNGTFLSLDPEASANLMDLITLKLDDLLIAHKDLVLLTSVDVRR